MWISKSEYEVLLKRIEAARMAALEAISGANRAIAKIDGYPPDHAFQLPGLADRVRRLEDRVQGLQPRGPETVTVPCDDPTPVRVKVEVTRVVEKVIEVLGLRYSHGTEPSLTQVYKEEKN